MIELLITLVVILGLCALVYVIINQMPGLPPLIRSIATILAIIIFAVWILQELLPMIHLPGIR